MFGKILKTLKDSIRSVSGKSSWDEIAKDLLKEEITGYRPKVRNEPVETAPIYKQGQLVKIRFHQHFMHLHQEIGIITEVVPCDSPYDSGSLHFYEVLVGDQKITILERFICGDVDDSENR